MKTGWRTVIVFGPLWLSGHHFVKGLRVINVINHCNTTIWPAYAGAVTGGQRSAGGFEADPGYGRDIDLPDGFNGHIWARQACDFSKQGDSTCATGSCPGGMKCTGPPRNGIGNTTLVTLSLNTSTVDLYEIEFGFAFNLPVEITSSNKSCDTLSCPLDFNPVCPEEWQAININGSTLACSVVAPGYGWFKKQCPVVALDSGSGRGVGVQQSCALSRARPPSFTVTFCPGEYTIAETPNGLSNSSSSTSYPPSTSPFPASSSRHLSTGAIVGIAIGSLSSLAILVLVAYLTTLRRRRRDRFNSPPTTPARVSAGIDPLILPGRNEHERRSGTMGDDTSLAPTVGTETPPEKMPIPMTRSVSPGATGMGHLASLPRLRTSPGHKATRSRGGYEDTNASCDLTTTDSNQDLNSPSSGTRHSGLDPPPLTILTASTRDIQRILEEQFLKFIHQRMDRPSLELYQQTDPPSYLPNYERHSP